jgi:hypothetical protein
MLIFARAIHMDTDTDPGGEAHMSAPPKTILAMKSPVRRRRRNANHVPDGILGAQKS